MLSVIVPVYNVEKYLARCIDSILKQSYSDLEIILVDDGSTDNSGKICDQYREIDDRIVVIHKQNGGLSDARNVGMKKANGQYLAFVDSDDFIHPRMYEILMNLLLDYKADMVISNFAYYDEEKKRQSSFNKT